MSSTTSGVRQHGARGGREEVPAAVPVLFLVFADQAQVGLVDQGGGLERLPRRFPGQLLGGQFAQLVVDQGQELAGGVGIALIDRGQDSANLAHRRHRNSVCGL
jgi:hypothetical protein